MKQFRVILIVLVCLVVAGLWVNNNFAWKSTPASYNPSVDYEADLVLHELKISNVSPSGFDATFKSERNQPLVVEWMVYPSDMLTVVYCGNGRFHSFFVDTYPEGGTILYRITDGIDGLPEHGTEWLYQDLPRPLEDTVLAPPYYGGYTK